MSNKRSDRLWKFEDAVSKVELYASGYGVREPRGSELRCDIVVRGFTFSGRYVADLGWHDILEFGQRCAKLRDAIEGGDDEMLGEVSLQNSLGFSISVEPSGRRQVKWRLACQPATMSDREVLKLTVTTEYQLLNSIASGARHIWQKYPGARTTGDAFSIFDADKTARR
jgi:hypothetical protein